MLEINILNGHPIKGHRVETAVRNTFGTTAFYRASQNPNNPHAGEVLRPTRNPREYKVLAVVASIREI